MNANQKEAITKLLDGPLMASSKAIMEYLAKEHLLYPCVLKCSDIGVYEGNRGGLGIDMGHMKELMESISTMGWVEGAYGSRVCIELDSSPASETTRHGDSLQCARVLDVNNRHGYSHIYIYKIYIDIYIYIYIYHYFGGRAIWLAALAELNWLL